MSFLNPTPRERARHDFVNRGTVEDMITVSAADFVGSIGSNSVTSEFPTQQMGGDDAGLAVVWKANWRFVQDTNEIRDEGTGNFNVYGTVGICNFGDGLDYTETSSVNHDHAALLVLSRRGKDISDGTEYLTDMEKGQTTGMHVASFSNRMSDGGAILYQSTRAYATGGGPLSGATSGVEGNIVARDETGVTLLNLGGFMGSLPPFDNVGITWAQQGVAFRAQLSTDSATVRGYAAYLSEEAGTTDGFLYLFAAHEGSGDPAYFYITGQRHPDGQGQIHGGPGSETNPCYSFVGAVDTGMYHVGSNVLGFSSNGFRVMTITSVAVGIKEDAPNYALDVNGNIGFNPQTTVTPVDNGDVTFALTSNTVFTVSARGSDGVVRSGTVTLA